jgi:glycosyltransferase involved in cell wall biosynthesis
MKPIQLSIVIPLLNEAESLTELHSWLTSVISTLEINYEIIYIDDGSTDVSWEIINNLAEAENETKAIRFLKNYGKSQALHAGFEEAQGEVVITMDADLQDNPEEIPALYQMIKEDGFHMVSGWKKVRHDSFFAKNLPSKLFNAVARKTSGLKLHDFNCGLKAFKKEVIKNIEVTGEMHRYIPVLAKNEGFSRIGEKIVKHQARKYGETKFGTERFINGFLDLISIWFLSKFGKRPMHFFGAWGVLMFIVGFFSAAWIGGNKLYKLYHHQDTILVTSNPWFYIALTAMLMGLLLFISGFLGELILLNNNTGKNYKIKSRKNIKN